MNKDIDSKFIFNWVLVNKIYIGKPLKSERDVFELKKEYKVDPVIVCRRCTCSRILQKF